MPPVYLELMLKITFIVAGRCLSNHICMTIVSIIKAITREYCFLSKKYALYKTLIITQQNSRRLRHSFDCSFRPLYKWYGCKPYSLSMFILFAQAL